jgi:hypothetical protein
MEVSLFAFYILKKYYKNHAEIMVYIEYEKMKKL